MKNANQIARNLFIAIVMMLAASVVVFAQYPTVNVVEKQDGKDVMMHERLSPECYKQTGNVVVRTPFGNRIVPVWNEAQNGNDFQMKSKVEPLFWVSETYTSPTAEYTIASNVKGAQVVLPKGKYETLFAKFGTLLDAANENANNFTGSVEFGAIVNGVYYPFSNFVLCYNREGGSYAYVAEYRYQQFAGDGTGYSVGQSGENAGETYEWHHGERHDYDPRQMEAGNASHTKLLWLTLPTQFQNVDAQPVFLFRDSTYGLAKNLTIAAGRKSGK